MLVGVFEVFGGFVFWVWIIFSICFRFVLVGGRKFYRGLLVVFGIVWVLEGVIGVAGLGEK